VAAMLNRTGTLGPAPGKRSRGELVLEALDHADAVAAADALRDLSPQAYRPFNMILVDNRDAFWLRHDGMAISVHPIAAGCHMIASKDLDAMSHPCVARHLPAFRAAAPPDPAAGDWTAWMELMRKGPERSRNDGLCLPVINHYGTVSSALVALPAKPGVKQRPIFYHADGAPNRHDWTAIEDDMIAPTPLTEVSR
jgi:hypothetical protein